MAIALEQVDPAHAHPVLRDALHALLAALLVRRLAARHLPARDVLLAVLPRRHLVQVVRQRLEHVAHEQRAPVRAAHGQAPPRELRVADVHLRERGRLAHLAEEVLVDLVLRELAAVGARVADDDELDGLGDVELDAERALALVCVVRAELPVQARLVDADGGALGSGGRRGRTWYGYSRGNVCDACMQARRGK